MVAGAMVAPKGALADSVLRAPMKAITPAFICSKKGRFPVAPSTTITDGASDANSSTRAIRPPISNPADTAAAAASTPTGIQPLFTPR
jgi:hypothetical protein